MPAQNTTGALASLQKNALNEAVKAISGLATDALRGVDFDDSLRSRALAALVGTGSATAANGLGALYDDGLIDPVSHKLAHTALGCLIGAVYGNCLSGAIGGGGR